MIKMTKSEFRKVTVEYVFEQTIDNSRKRLKRLLKETDYPPQFDSEDWTAPNLVIIRDFKTGRILRRKKL